MGLDYGLVRIKKNAMEHLSESERWSLWNDNSELAYGRKSWELVHMFGTDLTAGMSPLDPKDWDRFIKAVKEFGYENLEKAREDLWNDEETEISVAYEEWYDKTFDEYPTLGYDFSTGYMMSFYEADAAVRQAWADGDEVWTYASY